MSTNLIVVIILGAAGVAVLGFFYLQARGRRRAHEDIPPAMRPGYSDEQLERTVLERYMAWGLVLTAFFAIFLPLYMLREPMRLSAVQEGEFVESVESGEDLYQLNCAECHGQNLAGGAAPSPYDPTDAWPAPSLANLAARYEDSPSISGDIRQFILATIHRGRPGTPMPTWGADFGGPLTDQQIEDITNYILVNQVPIAAEPEPAVNLSGAELYQQNCARCHGEQLNGVVGPTLIGLFERHNAETVLGILRQGIYMPYGAMMPPWQEGYMYEGARYSDEALRKIIDYLEDQQPATLPPGADTYQSPYLGPDDDPGVGGELRNEGEPLDDAALDEPADV